MQGNIGPTAWETVRSDIIIADRWMTLRADECRDARGRTIAPFYVLEQGDWVSVLAVTDRREAVVVEEYHHGAGVVALGLIGGGIDHGEPPYAAAVRELREETGYAGTEVVALGTSWANWGRQPNRVHHFLIRGCERETEPALDDGELIVASLLPVDELGAVLAQSYDLLTWHKASRWREENEGP